MNTRPSLEKVNQIDRTLIGLFQNFALLSKKERVFNFMYINVTSHTVLELLTRMCAKPCLFVWALFCVWGDADSELAPLISLVTRRSWRRNQLQTQLLLQALKCWSLNFLIMAAPPSQYTLCQILLVKKVRKWKKNYMNDSCMDLGINEAHHPGCIIDAY